jgi:hypothetical protein
MDMRRKRFMNVAAEINNDFNLNRIVIGDLRHRCRHLEKMKNRSDSRAISRPGGNIN